MSSAAVTSAALIRSSVPLSPAYATWAPRACAYSLIPWTELWLSAVSTNRVRRPHGYASATRRQAPVALGVKMTAYSAAVVLKKRSTASRACSTRRVDALDVGLSECGLP